MWFEKENPIALYCDKRAETVRAWNYEREMIVSPDIVSNFTELPFRDESFYLVVFDPPHIDSMNENSRTAQIYGKLFPDWETDIAAGFSECFRVLKDCGTLVFKWNETSISTQKILKLTDVKPLFGHLSGKLSKTHWITFIKHNKSFKKDAAKDRRTS